MMTRAALLETLGRGARPDGARARLPRAGDPRPARAATGAEPVLALIALVFAYSLANSFLVESIFDWPGLGSYAVAAIQTLDAPAILGVTLFVALAYVIANLLVDLVQSVIDPRVRGARS